MDWISTLTHHIDPRYLLEQFSYWGLFLIVFAESGLLIGFFLPGDSLLLIAGVLASTGVLKLSILVPLVFCAAFLGDQVGYWMGAKFGRDLIIRSKLRFLNESHVHEAEAFFAKYGNKTIILARFVPIVRTFAPILAGIGKMPYQTFVLFNFFGALLWGVGITVAGYLVGNIPHIDRYLHYVIGLIILVSLLPVIQHLRNTKGKSSK